MAEIPFQSHHDLVEFRQELIDTQLHEGSISPLLLKQILAVIFLALIPLLFRPTNTFRSQLVRYAFHAIITGFSIYAVLYVRFIGPGNGYGVGMLTAWFFIWSSTILVFNDVQKDFERIEKEYVQPSTQTLHKSAQSRGILEPDDTKNDSKTSPVVVPRDNGKRKVYHWQSFPDSFPHRVDWAIDLVLNFRGPNWNWRAKSAPPPPDVVLNDIGDQRIFRQVTASRLEVVQDSSKRLRRAFYSFSRAYMALDIIKLIMMRDPYFWGVVENSPPPPWPFAILSFSPILVRIYRILLSISGVYFALDYVVSLDPLFFLGLSLAFPRFSRSITHQPLDEAWLYPQTFGPVSSFLDQGLIGAWNTLWHQLFRFGFSESGRFISNLVIPRTITPGQKKQEHSYYTLARRVIQVLVAFSASGLIHAMGSYTAIADTKPFNSFLFFFLQGIGVLVQGFFSFFRRKSQPQSRPTLSNRALNFIVVFVWFYFTGPLIADDFARSGMWTFEPLPFSPINGLAEWWGVEGWEESWFCWRSSWFEQWDGETWWQSGIRLR